MDTHSPGREDDLSNCERRLANWQPAAGNLDADAMLFAAGRAAGRRRRAPMLWPTLCALLAAQAAGLGVWGLWERAERVTLAGRLPERALASTMPQAPPVVERPEPRYSPSPDDYFHLRRRLEQEPGRWLASAQTVETQVIGSPPPPPSILRAGQQDGPLPQ
jgi:hypothetical protein